jgi:hypothetical protein
VLEWAANDGFEEFMRQYEYTYKTPHEFRQRYLVSAISSALRRSL